MISAEENARVPDGILKQHFDGKQSGIFFLGAGMNARLFFFSRYRSAPCDRFPKFMTLSTTSTMRSFGVMGIISYSVITDLRIIPLS